MKTKIIFLKIIVYLFIFLNCIYIIFPISTQAVTGEINQENNIELIEENSRKNNEEYILEESEEIIEQNKTNEAQEVLDVPKEITEKNADIKSNLEQIPGYTPSDRYYYNGKEVCQLYTGTYANNPVYKYTNQERNKSLNIGEEISIQNFYIKRAICNCGNILVEQTPDWYAVDSNRKLTYSDSSIVKDLKWKLSGYIPKDSSESGYSGYPSLEMKITGAKPGKTQIKYSVYQNYYYAYYWKSCRRCGQVYSEISFKGKWIEDNETVNITVNSDYNIIYDSDFNDMVSNMPTGETKTVAEILAKFNISKETPTREGYTFLGWTDIKNSNQVKYQPGDEITLDWKEGYGSTENPVSKTLYAVWEEDEIHTYTVIYTDGVAGEIVFPDEGYEGLKEGDKTPEFERGEPTREGYTFMGWAPSVNPIVKSSDCNENGEIIYTATWQKDQPKPIYANYKVEWYDINDNKLKTDEYRIGTIGNKVQVTDEDKAIEGYTFDAENEKNVLEETLKEDGSTVLKLYFIQDKNEIKEPNKTSEKNYKVEWYDINDNKLKIDEYRTGTIGNKVQVTENDKVISGYIFDAKNEKNILEEILEEDGSIVLKLYFIKEKNEIKEPNTPPNAESEKNYKVEWYDIYGNKLKETEIRTDIIGNIVEVTSGDKIIDGYTFIEYYKENNLSQELDKDGNVILKLHFKVEDEKLNSTNPEETDKKVSEINTGDNSRTTIYAILTMVSLIGIITILFLMKNKKIEGKHFK